MTVHDTIKAAATNAEPDGKNTPAMIAVDGLFKRYGRKGAQAVNGVSFAVEKGRIFGLLGPDGAGKTSIIQTLAGVLSVNAGTAHICGIDAIRHPERIKPLIGYMPQGLGLNLYDSLTVAENIEFFRDLRGVPEPQFSANRDSLLAMTRLAPFLDRPAGKLSGGMRQKLALICTLVHLPDILLLDEPTTGVDPISRRDFWTIIHNLVAERDVTVLLATSYMDEAERCDTVSLIHEGGQIASGPPEELMAELSGANATIHSNAPEQVMSVTQLWPETVNAALFGREVRLLVSERPPNIERRLRDAGIAEATVKWQPAGLEEVFVHELAQARSRDGLSGTVVEHVPRNFGDGKTKGTDGGIAVRTSGLTCRFGQFTAVDRVDIEIENGTILGLLGPNGAGKTTLIKMLCGLQRPSEGFAEVAGFAVDHSPRQLRYEIGYMSQRFSLYRDLSVRANLRLNAGLYGLSRKNRDSRIDGLLEELDLTAYANRIPGALPLGIRQRLGLANAMLHGPRILFLDEPTSGVDPIARRRFWNIVHLLARRDRVTVLVSTHYMDEAEHCDRLGFMQQGRLIVTGAPAELADQAEQRAGPLVVVRTGNFAPCFSHLKQHFANAMLHGRRIQWQSQTPDADMNKATELLRELAPDAQISQQPLSMEETFVSFLKLEGTDNV